MIPIKSRNQKAKIYESKFSDIPRDYMERLSWMYDKFNISKEKSQHIINMRNQMIEQLKFGKDYLIILYEIPEGAVRPRARRINKSNVISNAINNPGFIQVYSPNAASDRVYLQRLLSNEDFAQFNQLIYTPCNIEFNAYFQTPKVFNATDIYLAELGCIRPICKPDFDNIEKKYADMYNGNVWLDDSLVIDGSIHKYYSILPRVEIKLRYLNMLFNKYQYNSILKRVEEGTKVEYFDTSLKRNDL